MGSGVAAAVVIVTLWWRHWHPGLDASYWKFPRSSLCGGEDGDRHEGDRNLTPCRG